jgi:2-oxoglutarate dehydrogenase complex dehydrogenase (E1) component-like enzyme
MSLISKTNKGQKMEQNIVTGETDTPSNQSIAESVVKDLPANEIVKEIQRLLDDRDWFKADAAKNFNRSNEQQSKYLNLYSTISDFITEHVKDDDISTDDLKELAEELNIRLTKTIKVKFTVACEYEFEVPLDFEDNDIDESDFSINISSSISNDDVEETHESIDVTDFEVEEA